MTLSQREFGSQNALHKLVVARATNCPFSTLEILGLSIGITADAFGAMQREKASGALERPYFTSPWRFLIVQLFECTACQQPLYFEHLICESCGRRLGFLDVSRRGKAGGGPHQRH